MKKLSSLVALFLMCLGMATQAQTIETIGENITDPATQLTEGSYVIFKNVSTGKYPYVDQADINGVKMGTEAKVGAGTDYLWQVHVSGTEYFFTCSNGNFFPRPKTLAETKNGMNCAGHNGAYKGSFVIAKHTNTSYWTLQCQWTENKTKKHNKFWSVDGDMFAGIDVASKDEVSTQYEIIPVTIKKSSDQLELEALVNPWKEVVGYVGAYEKNIVDKAAKCATVAEAQAVFDAATKVALDEKEYYQIVNVKTGEALTVNNGNLAKAEKDLAQVSQFWRFAKTEKGYTLKNPNFAQYVQIPGTSALADAAVDFILTDKEKAEWTLTAGDKVLALTAEGFVAGDAATAEAHWYLAPVEQLKVYVYPSVTEVAEATDRWASIYLPFNAYSMNADLQYYSVDAVSETSANLVPAKGVHITTGLILKATGTKDFFWLKIGKLAEGKTEAPAKNLLKGTNVAMPKTATSLVLGKGEQGVGLYHVLDNVENLKANKAYLEAAAGVNGLRFVIGEATGIEGVEVATPADNVYYDLSGRRVANPVKGIYILNGKKVYVK